MSRFVQAGEWRRTTHKQIAVYLDDDHMRMLEEIAAALGTKKSDALRTCVRVYAAHMIRTLGR